MEFGKNLEIYHIGDEDEISIEDLTRYTGKLMGYEGKFGQITNVSRFCC